MEFLNPGFLYALAALAIPIIIHLFNFRRFKKIAFTNVRFLREIKQKTQNQNRLKHLLVLLMRLLAFLFLVLAFAQPYIPTDDNAEKNAEKMVSVFVDNSFSMEGESEAGVMLEVAKNRAIDIADVYSSTDRFQVLTHDFEGKHQHFVARSEFVNAVQEIELSPQSQNLEQILNRQSDLLGRESQNKLKQSFIVSDFQKSRFDFSSVKPDTTSSISLVHLDRNSPNNIYIDSVWFPTPIRKIGASDAVNIRIANNGNEPVENVSLKLEINGKQKAIGSFGAAANATVDTSLTFIHEEPGIQRMEISLNDFPITYDDTYFLSYKVYNQLEILAIENGSSSQRDFLKDIFKGDSTLEYTNVSVNQVDYAALDEQDLIVLYELGSIPSGLSASLSAFAKNGGSVFIIPAEEIETASYNAFLAEVEGGAFLEKTNRKADVKNLNTGHPLYRGVFEKIPRNIDLPSAKAYYKLSRPVRSSADYLMSFGNGDEFLTSYIANQGRIYCLAGALRSDENNFSRHALFVASTLRMAEMSRATSINAIDIGGKSAFSIPAFSMGMDAVFHLVNADQSVDVIPNHMMRQGKIEINPGPGIQEAGNYLLLLGEDTVSAVGMNYKRAESDLESHSREELVSIAERAGTTFKVFDGNAGNLKSAIEKEETGTELWKICLILVLLFLLAETLLLRFWKKAKS